MPRARLSAEVFTASLGKPSDHADVRALLYSLALSGPPPIADGVSSDIEVVAHGVALFFRAAHHLQNAEHGGALSPDTSVFSDVQFSSEGYGGGPPFAGELPQGIQFTDGRDALRQQLGPAHWTSPIVPNDRWHFGDRYLTVAFSSDSQRVRLVTCGLAWMI